MNNEDIHNLIKNGEGPTLDFKKSDFLGDNFKVAKAMTALANTFGGTLLLGVNDDGTLEGYTFKPKHREFLNNVAVDRCDPPVRPKIEVISNENSDIVVVEISKFTNHPHGVKTDKGNLYFIRMGDQNRAANSHELHMLFNSTSGYLRGLIEILKEEVKANFKKAKDTSEIFNSMTNFAKPIVYEPFSHVAWDSIVHAGEINIFNDTETTERMMTCYRDIQGLNALINVANSTLDFSKLEQGDHYGYIEKEPSRCVITGVGNRHGAEHINMIIRSRVSYLNGLLSLLAKKLDVKLEKRG